jgi:radical SAM superfamily enzyme YgiQ (UPF0313 family)
LGNVVLISTYEMGRQPFGLASPAAWLVEAGADVSVQDLAVSHFDPESVAGADLVAFYVPMHTATRLADPVLERVRRINPEAHICFYGLYASMNESHLRSRGADTILGGEFEGPLMHCRPSLSSVRVSRCPTGQVSQPWRHMPISNSVSEPPAPSVIPNPPAAASTTAGIVRLSPSTREDS